MHRGFDQFRKAMLVPKGALINALLLIFFLSAPLWLNEYLLHVLIMIFLYAFLGSSWNLIGGYAGQFSFGHGAFYGIGAYTSSMLFIYWGVSPWIGMIIGAGLSALFAAGSGFLSFRYGLKGPFFALVTLAYAEMLRLVTNSLEVTGAAVGLFLPILGNSPLQMQFASKVPYYYIILFMALGLFIFTKVIEKQKIVFYLRALCANEDTAEATGVNAFKYKLIAFMLSAFFTAAGGTFYAQYFLFIDPIIVFGVGASIDILIRPIIGGVATVWGPVIGAFLLGALSESTRGFLRGYIGIDVMLYGAILILVLLFMPNGIVGWARQQRQR